jgi:hypothetical protein
MLELKIGEPVAAFSIGVNSPAAGLPHLPDVITNLAVDQALDLVAKTFRGVVLYQYCKSAAEYAVFFADAGLIYATPRE